MSARVLDAFAAATGCDRVALEGLVGQVRPSAALTPTELVDRVAAQERLAQAAQAAQACDLEAFAGARLAQGRAEQVPDHLQGRTAAQEVALALQLSPISAGCRIVDATRAVFDHPELLALVGTGAVSMAGLRRVTGLTEVLDPEQRRLVDTQLAGDASRARLTPGQLGRAAEMRVLAADPEAAARRAAAARRRRGVRLGDPTDGSPESSPRCAPRRRLRVFAALDHTARGMRRDGDPRSLDELRADLFVEWVTGVRMVEPTEPTEPTEPAPAESPVTWRSVDGWEPWTWSEPPPVVPDRDADPASDDPAWDHRFDDRPDPSDAEHGLPDVSATRHQGGCRCVVRSRW